MPGKICFRGDDRAPTDDGTPTDPNRNIFRYGFRKRAPDGGIVYREGDEAAGDIDPHSAVCVSARFTGATMFPLRFDAGDPRVSDTWIYCVYVDVADLYETHRVQVADGLTALRRRLRGKREDEKDAEAAAALWPLFAHELATERVPAGDVIAAVRCTRTWRGDDWSAGEDYVLHGPVLANPACTAPAEYVAAATDFLDGELAGHAHGSSPAPDSGYHRSTGT